MKKQPRKLDLRPDTVRHLNPIELTQVGGGYGNSHNVCDPPGSGGSCSRASI
jgi:hypothetical protein